MKTTYCQSCPIYKTCDEPSHVKKTLKWCYERERILKPSKEKTQKDSDK